MSSSHNKSGLTTLSFLQEPNEVLFSELDKALSKSGNIVKIQGIVLDSPCFYINNQKRNIRRHAAKDLEAYHIVALKKFGRNAIEKVPPSKVCCFVQCYYY